MQLTIVNISIHVASDLTLEMEIPSSKEIQQKNYQCAQTLSPSSSKITLDNNQRCITYIRYISHLWKLELMVKV